MTTLGRPLVVVDTTAYCDSSHEHESRITTDGHTAVAGGTGLAGVDHGTGWRSGASVYFTCRQPDRADEPCGGTIEVPLVDWTGDPDAVQSLVRYGQALDQ